jgi:hypothetical protein
LDSFPSGIQRLGLRKVRGGNYQTYSIASNKTFELLVFAGKIIPADTRSIDIGFRCAR